MKLSTLQENRDKYKGRVEALERELKTAQVFRLY
jgi:hypothetical protein